MKQFLIIIGAILLFSCDPTEFELPVFESQNIFPLINDEYTFDDITFVSTANIAEADNGDLVFTYISNTDTLRVFEQFDIPDVQFDVEIPGLSGQVGPLNFGVNINTQDIGLEEVTIPFLPPTTLPSSSQTIEATDFQELSIQDGQLLLTINNNFPISISSGFVFELVNSTGQVVFTQISREPLPPGSSITNVIDLANQNLSFPLFINLRNLQTPGGSNIMFNSESSLNLGLSLQNLLLRSAIVLNGQFQADANFRIPINFPNDAHINQFTIKNAIADLSNRNSTNLPAALELTFLESTNELGENLVFAGNLSTSQQSFELNEATLLIEDGEFLNVNIAIQVDVQEPLQIVFGQAFPYRIVIRDISPRLVLGSLGSFNGEIKSELEVGLFDRIRSGSISFDGISAILGIRHNMGLGAQVDNNGNVLLVGTNPRLSPDVQVNLGDELRSLNLPRTPTQDEVIATTLIISDEEILDDFLSILPSNIELSIPWSVGSEFADTTQFLSDESFLTGQLEIEIPIRLSAQNLTISDTIDFTLDQEIEFIDFISGSVNYFVTSTFPLELRPQVIFLDSSFQVLDSLFVASRVIAPAQIENGLVQEPSEAQFEMQINEEKFAKLERAHFAVPIFTISSFGQGPVSIRPDFSIDLDVTADIVTQIDVNR